MAAHTDAAGTVQGALRHHAAAQQAAVKLWRVSCIGIFIALVRAPGPDEAIQLAQARYPHLDGFGEWSAVEVPEPKE
jgi:hypothetical protein